MSSRIASVTLWMALAGCRAGLEDPTFATGSQSIVGSKDHATLYSVNVDEGTLSRVVAATGQVSTLRVGSEPTRVARAGDKLLVTLRGERALAVVVDDGAGLVMTGRLDVGAEPYGIVASEDGTRAYVALSQEDAVVEIDAVALQVLRRWDVPGLPSWVALHPSGKTLAVASQIGGRLTSIDLETAGATPQEFTYEDPFGAGEDRMQGFTRRLTGDLAFSPDGRLLAAPGLWVDNKAGEAAASAAEIAAGLGSQYYTSDSSLTLSRLNPGVLVVDADGDGGLRVESGRAVFVAGQSLVADGDPVIVRSYLGSVAFAPDGRSMYATMEASRTVVAISTGFVYPNESLCSFCVSASLDSGAIFPGDGGFLEAASVQIATGEGPKGVAFLDDEAAYVHTFLDRSVAALPVSAVGDHFQAQVARAVKDEAAAVTAHTPVPVEVSSLPADVEQGRRLFYAATDDTMAGAGAGVSCSTCHFEGRNDGLTWPLASGPRQTPSLIGGLSQTNPVTWTDDVADAGTEAGLTSTGRMGGAGPTSHERAAITSFLDSLRPVDRPERGVETDAVARGRVLFEREDVGCASCHSGARYTDRESHDLYGLTGVDTPTLTGIAATAPYLHDGSAPTLRAVLETGRDGLMGDTSMLSEAELDDLEAYLRAL